MININKTNTSVVGDIAFDESSNIASVYDGASWNAITMPDRSPLIIDEDATIKIGDLTIDGSHFKACMKVLLKMAKEEYPEDFI